MRRRKVERWILFVTIDEGVPEAILVFDLSEGDWGQGVYVFVKASTEQDAIAKAKALIGDG